jgi:hypothetical protein
MTWQMLQDYLLLNLNKYFDNVDFPINLFIIAITIGACIATFSITVHKRYTATLVRGLVRHGAFDEESAVTLERLHITPSLFLKSALLRHGQLTDMVAFVKTDEEVTKDNLHKIPLFVKSERVERAQHISEGLIPSYLSAAGACFIFITVALALVILMPEILTFISGIKL